MFRKVGRPPFSAAELNPGLHRSEGGGPGPTAGEEDDQEGIVETLSAVFGLDRKEAGEGEPFRG